MSKFFEISDNTFEKRRTSMSNQSFQAVRRLQEAGAPLPLVLANPAWQSLMDKVDSNINERSQILQEALSKLSGSTSAKRLLEGVDDSQAKRSRTSAGINELDARKHALLSKIETIQGVAAPDESYEAYRQQCWVQYYEWVEQQKKGVPSAPLPPPPAEEEADEDEEIHRALLGLS